MTIEQGELNVLGKLLGLQAGIQSDWRKDFSRDVRHRLSPTPPFSTLSTHSTFSPGEDGSQD